MPAPLIGLALGALRAVAGRAIASAGAQALRATAGRVGQNVVSRGVGMEMRGNAQHAAAQAARRGAGRPLTTQQSITTNNYSSTTLQNSNNPSTTSNVSAELNTGRPTPTSGIPPIGGDGTSVPSQSFDPEITRLNSRDAVSRIGQTLANLIPAIGGIISRIHTATNKHYDFVKAQGLGKYSGLTAVADAQIQVGNIQRKIGRAHYTAETEYYMTKARDRLEQAKEPFRAVYQQGMNAVTGVVYNLESAAYEKVGEMMKNHGGLVGTGLGGVIAGPMGGYLGAKIGNLIGEQIEEAEKHQSKLDLLQQSFLGNMAHPKKDDKAQQAAKRFSRNVGTPQGPARTSGGY